MGGTVATVGAVTTPVVAAVVVIAVSTVILVRAAIAVAAIAATAATTITAMAVSTIAVPTAAAHCENFRNHHPPLFFWLREESTPRKPRLVRGKRPAPGTHIDTPSLVSLSDRYESRAAGLGPAPHHPRP